MGLEILKERTDIETIIAPVAGGGLLSGISASVKSINPGIKIYGVQPEQSNSMYKSYKSSKICSKNDISTIADALIAKKPEQLTLDLCLQYVDDIILVSERNKNACYLLAEWAKYLIEPSRVVALSAVITGKVLEHNSIVVVLSVENTDLKLIGDILKRGVSRMPWIHYIILSMGHMVTDFAPGSILIIMTHMKEIMELNYTQTTIIFLIIELTSSFMQPIFGMLVDKKKMMWLIPVAISLSIGAISLVGLIKNYYLLLFIIFLSGIGVAAFHPQASKTTYLISRGSMQASAMSIFSIGGTAGMGIGPILVAWFITMFALKGTLLFLIPGALMIIILIPLLNRIKGIIDEKEDNSDDFAVEEEYSEELRVRSLFFLIAFVILRSWIHAGIINFIPLYYIDHLGRSDIYGSRLLTFFLIAGAVGTLIAGPMADRFGFKKMLLYSMIFTLPLTYLLFNTSGYWGLIFAALDGAVLICTFGITVVFGQKLLSNNIGLASGLMIGLGGGVGAIGATILGFIADTWNIYYSLKVIFVLPVVGLVLILLLPNISGESVELNNKEKQL